MVLDGETASSNTPVLLVLAALSLSICFTDLFSITILQKCIRLSKQLRVLAQNVIFCDGLFHVTLAIGSVSVGFIKNEQARMDVINYSLLFHATILIMYCSLMVLSSIERLVSIRFPNEYYRLLHVSNVKRLISGIYLVAIVLLSSSSISIAIRCRDDNRNCQSNSVFTFQSATIILLSIINILTLISVGIYTVKVSKDHINRLRHQYPSMTIDTKTPAFRIMSHVAVFTATFLLVGISINVFKQSSETNVSLEFQGFLGIISYLSICLNTLVSQYYHVYSLKESRLILRRIFCTWNEEQVVDYEERRIEIYNIPTRLQLKPTATVHPFTCDGFPDQSSLKGCTKDITNINENCEC